MSQTIEELCEMAGIVIFIDALLDSIGREIGPLQLNCAPGQPARSLDQATSTPNVS